MHVLVINSGSSSIKYELFDLDAAASLASGLVERIGEDVGRATHEIGDERITSEEAFADHDAGFRELVSTLERAGLADGLGAIGHRVVHGGEAFSAPALLDDDVVATIREQVPLAPLHNPANLRGIEVARELRGDLPQVAVFDTAFHATMPPAAYRYAVPADWYEEHGVRRYGFHGTSHGYVAGQAAAWLGRDVADVDVVTLHLGNGASACAVAGGRSIDTSMGLTPLEGLVMGTRSGDLDPAVIFHVARSSGQPAEAVESILNRESGLKGLCGANDVREVERRAAGGDADAQLALDVYVHRIRRYLGAFLAVLGGADAIVFTAGVGENSATVRARVCAGLQRLGIALDADANAEPADGQVRAVHADASRTAVLVVPTDEEREIAEQTAAVVAAVR